MNSLKRTSIPLGALLVAVFAVGAENVGATGHAGDFNGDGADDVLLRHLHSDTWRYYTLVDDVPVAHDLAIPADPAWRFVATGDFDGNGYDDILLRNVDTLASVYYAVTATGAERRAISLTKNPLYDFLGTGDFDGDGKDEILIRRNRDFGLWLYYDIEGRRATLRRNLGIGQNLDYEFAGIGDFDGDGRDDVLLRHRDVGSWVYYEMHPTAPGTHRRPGITRNPLFTFHAVADITGDGRDDVMLRNTKSREWIYYAMTGPRALLQRPPGMTRNPRWTLQAIGDFDGSGRATPLIRLSVSGGWALYDIQGLEAQVVHFPGMSREQTWAAVGTLPAFHEGNPAQFSRIEFLQGPPTFRKDYRARQTIGPINASRAESGEALEPWVWGGNFLQGPGVDVWFEKNRGFVTSVWQRRMVVAVEATHVYRSSFPTMTVELVPAEGAAVPLDVLLDVTEPDLRGGYRTEMVFNLPAEDNLPGGELVVRIDTEGVSRQERLPLFGETVTPLSLTWIPVRMDGYEPQGLGTDGYIDRVVPHLPIGPHRTRIGKTLVYEASGEEGDRVFDRNVLFDQTLVHHAAHACGKGDLYFAIYPLAEMQEAGIDIHAIGVGAGRVALGPSFLGGPDHWGGRPWNGVIGLYAHEVGHTLDLRHAPCEVTVSVDDAYPYADGGLGPARSWHTVFNHFVEREDGYRDIMSYCPPKVLSDYSYQRALMYLQAPHYAEWSREADACWNDDEEGAAAERTLAVVGRVAPDGTATIVGTAESTLPPTAPAPAGAPDTWLLSLLDSGGGELYRQRVSLESNDGHGHGLSRGRIWRARVPYAAARGGTLVMRDGGGAIRMQRSVEAVR